MMTNDNEIWNNDNDVIGVILVIWRIMECSVNSGKREKTGFRVISVLKTD